MSERKVSFRKNARKYTATVLITQDKRCVVAALNHSIKVVQEVLEAALGRRIGHVKVLVVAEVFHESRRWEVQVAKVVKDIMH